MSRLGGSLYKKSILPVVVICLCSCASFNSNAAVFSEKAHVSRSIEEWTARWEILTKGVDITRGKTESPKLEFYALRINLADVKIVMNDAENTDGTILSTKVSTFARKYACLAAINAGPFDPVSAKEYETRKIIGIFVNHGVAFSPPSPLYGAIVFWKNGDAAILNQAEIKNEDHFDLAVGGFRILLKDGLIPESIRQRKARHPRTAVALNGNGSVLFMLVIDGRQYSSIGASEAESAEILQKLGAQDALNLDGGGSSSLVVNKNGSIRLINKPVHRFLPGFERAVATCIGVVAEDGPASNESLKRN
jgi:exopolysaccharide biosynthesis protein